MTQVAPYCKAYPARRFEEFAGWTPRDETTSTEETASRIESTEHDPVEEELEDYLFLHDTFVVTRGILPDEEIVFDCVLPEWIEFCRTTLGFAVPEDLLDDAASQPAEVAADRAV